MELFSQRKGLKPVKSIIQVDGMDEDLRTGLWNALTAFYWSKIDSNRISGNKYVQALLINIWFYYFKRPLDTLNNNWSVTYKEIREYFWRAKWYEVYDFIEFVANNYRDYGSDVNAQFIDFCNDILETELSAYRFVGGKITQITSEEEISEIEKAQENTETLKPVNVHLKTALDLLSDRKSPDYRNSIKESISAVEAICNIITNEKNSTLSQALEKIGKDAKVRLHPALEKAFIKLYGYTSDDDGIRHALFDEPNISLEDARFMLVSCSAFINYLIVKASKAGIKI